jgi:hypothetical protein
MGISVKEFAGAIRRRGGRIGAAKVADMLEECDRQAVALEIAAKALPEAIALLRRVKSKARGVDPFLPAEIDDFLAKHGGV